MMGNRAASDALLSEWAGAPEVALSLAGQLRDQGRFEDACRVVEKTLGRAPAPTMRRQLCLFLEESGRQDQAYAWLRKATEQHAANAEDFAHAGRLASQLGKFVQARKDYLAAVALGLDPLKWKVAEALAICQRYTDAEHPDIALFEGWLHSPPASPADRAGPLFALGKVYDDLGEFRQAATCWREANALLRAERAWNADAWHRQLDVAMHMRWAKPAVAASDWTPVFVLGLPRTGSTLVAELLARNPGVRNRGELTWIPQLHDQIVSRHGQEDPQALAEAAEYYRRMVVQDDAPAQWYLDKQPFNFACLGLIGALFPQAQVIHCVRDPRDTALSIWSQRFGGDAANFMFDFDAIATVGKSCRDLMRHWCRHSSLAIHTVEYESLVSTPESVIRDLLERMGMPHAESIGPSLQQGAPPRVVATASMWQVRQAITTKSVGRWRHYVDYVPELSLLFDPEKLARDLR